MVPIAHWVELGRTEEQSVGGTIAGSGVNDGCAGTSGPSANASSPDRAAMLPLPASCHTKPVRRSPAASVRCRWFAIGRTTTVTRRISLCCTHRERMCTSRLPTTSSPRACTQATKTALRGFPSAARRRGRRERSSGADRPRPQALPLREQSEMIERISDSVADTVPAVRPPNWPSFRNLKT